MTVCELKKELEQYDNDTEVVVDCNNEYMGQDIDEVDIAPRYDDYVHIRTGCGAGC